MAALNRLIPAILLAPASPARADAVDQWWPLIEQAATRFGVPTSWVERVIRAESRGFTTLNGRPIRSRAGAMGLMQLMPATWTEMRMRLALGANPDDPHDNIVAGTFFLRLLYDRFGYPGLFGAYSAGPGAYAGYLTGKRRLPAETMAYLGTLTGSAQPLPAAGPSAAPSSLFVVLRTVPADPSSSADRAQPASLFAVGNVGR